MLLSENIFGLGSEFVSLSCQSALLRGDSGLCQMFRSSQSADRSDFTRVELERKWHIGSPAVCSGSYQTVGPPRCSRISERGRQM